MKNKNIRLRSWQKAVILTALWLCAAVGFRLLADNVFNSILLHIAYVMLILPSATFAAAFYFTRICGLKPWLPIFMAVSALILYFFFGYSELSPDFLVTNIICGFFGFGIGNIFKNEAKIAVQENTDNEKKRLKSKAEKEYVPILSDKKEVRKK